VTRVFSSDSHIESNISFEMALNNEIRLKLLNTRMRKMNLIMEKNNEIDVELLASLKQLGIVQSQYDLSRLCGMNDSYFSSMKAKGYGMKIGSLACLWVELSRRSREISEPRVGAVLHRAAEMVQWAIQEKCNLRRLSRSEAGGR
jgi:hypothetical protein